MAHSFNEVDCVVIGAGVVGLAVARALALAGREVLVLEAQGAIGTGTSARNSEVIHAGLYYAPDLLKARLCVRGRDLLYAYCAARGVPHRRCGKLIVATAPHEVARLEALAQRAATNGVHDLQWLDAAAARALEPALACEAALHSPSTGIIDSHALMLALQGDLEHAGGMVVLHSKVNSAKVLDGRAQAAILLEVNEGEWLQARTVVNAAGLQACALARRFAGLDPRHVPTPCFAKGNYFTFMGRAPFRHLIYPVPQVGGLGVHLTLDLAGQAKFGPDVQWLDVGEGFDAPDDFSVDATRAAAFYAAVRRYWPDLPDGALAPGYAGIRPKIKIDGAISEDFCIVGPAQHGVPGLVHLFGIESPGLTSALAIAECVLQSLAEGLLVQS